MIKAYTIRPARYAKGQMAVHTVSDGSGFKTRADCLIGDHLKGRYSGRERAYIVSPSKARKFEKLYAEGYDANCVSGDLIKPKED